MPNIKPGIGFVLATPIKDSRQFLKNTTLLSPEDPELKFLNIAAVVSVGDAVTNADGFILEKPQLAQLDVVAYQKLAAHNMRVGTKNYVLIPFEHIIATIEDKENN